MNTLTEHEFSWTQGYLEAMRKFANHGKGEIKHCHMMCESIGEKFDEKNFCIEGFDIPLVENSETLKQETNH